MKRIALLTGLAALIGLLQVVTGCEYDKDTWIDCEDWNRSGIIHRILTRPVQYWAGKEWLTLIGAIGAVYLIVKSRKPNT